jgi:hypothetical protein
MNKKLSQFIFFILLGFLSPSIYAAACSSEPLTDSDDCYTTPDYYTITLFEMGLCQNIDEQSTSVPDISASCSTTYSNSSGAEITVENNVSSDISGGTSTRPANGTYTHGYIKVDARIVLKTDLTFSSSQSGSGTGSGTTCWTNGSAASTGTGTDCGSASDSNPQNMNVDVIALGCSTPSDNFYCRYEGDAEGLDDTYAWLVDSDGTKSTSISYSSSSGDVKYLIGIAKFSSSKTVTDASTAMEAQFRVTRGLKVDFVGSNVNYNIQEFKVLTTVY